MEITAQVLSLEVKDDYNGMKNHATGVYCQILIKNEKTSELEGAPCYAFVSSSRIELPPAKPNTFVDIKDLDTAAFSDVISNAIINNPEIVAKIKFIGGCLGLCEAPPRKQEYTARPIDKRRTDGGLEYNDQGIAIMNLK